MMVRRRLSVREAIIQAFKEQPATQLGVDYLIGYVGASKWTVQEVIRNLLKEEALPGLQVVIRGQAWQYVPEEIGAGEEALQAAMAAVNEEEARDVAKELLHKILTNFGASVLEPTDLMYIVGATYKGYKILQDADGKLWKAKEM